MENIKADILAAPRWYRWALIALCICYISGWIYTLHIAAVQREKGVPTVMPVLANGDSGEYASLSTSLLKGEGFHINGVTHTFRTPGYPAFIALTRFLSSGSFFATTLFQIFLVCASSILIWRIGTMIFSSRTGMAASLVYMANSLVFASSLIIMTETLFAFLLILGVYLSLTLRSDSPWYKPLLIGLVFGLATYVRPVGILALPLYVAPLFILKMGAKRVLLYAVTIAVVSVGATVPWMMRNKKVSGVFSFSSLPALNLTTYNLPQFLASKEGTSIDYQQQKIKDATQVIFPTQAKDLSYSPVLLTYGATVLKENLFSYARYHLLASWPFLFSSYVAAANDIYHRAVGKPVVFQSTWRSLESGDWYAVAKSFIDPPWKLADRAVRLSLYVLFLMGVCLYRKSKAMWFCSFSILYLMLLNGPVSQARYVLPAIPFIGLVAAAGLDIIPSWRRQKLPSESHFTPTGE